MADENIFVMDDPEADDFKNVDTAPAAFKKPVPSASEATLSDAQKKRVKIVLEEADNIPPNGLFIGHNGVGYQIKPGVEVSVPIFLLDILNHAVESHPVVDPETKQVIGSRDRLRYNYRLLAA